MTRSFVRRFGLVLVSLGALLLVWGFATWRWGDPVTGMYTKWEQRRLSGEYEQLAKRHRAELVPVQSPRAAARELRRAAERMRSSLTIGEPIGRIHIERLGLDMVIVNGTDTASLRKGPGRDPQTYLPGEGELVYIAGHRTTFGAPFANIDRLQEGDPIVLEMPYGEFRYEVAREAIVPADDVGRLRSRGREEVALQACHPRFSARERYIVYALPAGDSQLRRPSGAR